LPGAAQTRILILFAANLAIAILVFVSTGDAGAARTRILSAEALTGQNLWQARNCVACHALYGLGGHTGPDLTNVISRIGEDSTQAVLAYGRGKMPPQGLTPREQQSLAAYLAYIDSTGIYPTGTFPDHAFGRTREE
jgi:mono/diheme cytochrome c family protein